MRLSLKYLPTRLELTLRVKSSTVLLSGRLQTCSQISDWAKTDLTVSNSFGELISAPTSFIVEVPGDISMVA